MAEMRLPASVTAKAEWTGGISDSFDNLPTSIANLSKHGGATLHNGSPPTIKLASSPTSNVEATQRRIVDSELERAERLSRLPSREDHEDECLRLYSDQSKPWPQWAGIRIVKRYGHAQDFYAVWAPGNDRVVFSGLPMNNQYWKPTGQTNNHPTRHFSRPTGQGILYHFRHQADAVKFVEILSGWRTYGEMING